MPAVGRIRLPVHTGTIAVGKSRTAFLNMHQTTRTIRTYLAPWAGYPALSAVGIVIFQILTLTIAERVKTALVSRAVGR